MTRLALCLLLLATGASAAPQPQENVIDVQHDSQRGVTCYLLNGVGISCIPDSQLQAGNQRQQSPSEREKGLTPAAGAPQWDDKKYSL
ncbi:hypothetical protein AAZU54_01475 [Pseudomonas sp. Je.1.5.c]|uniref:hypothetical protein n=1 Tax=Pseudomonas sp. Je.1.5.c TaxID=3142839 RepID=UPI003DA96A65